MDYDTFIGNVQNRARLSSREDALQVTRVTLELFSRRIEPGAADNLAAQLPEEIGHHLEKVDTVEPFSWDEYVSQLVDAGGYTPETEEADAVHHARVVFDVIEDATHGTALTDIRDQLPVDEDWDELFVLVDQETPPVEADQRPD